MIKKIEGIVVSDVDYKESSKIINVLTKNEGIVGVLARGSKKVKSNLSGVTSRLTYGYFHINYRDSGLSSLIEVDIIDKFKNTRLDIFKMSYSLYLMELCMMVYKHEDNNNIYDILISALKKIDEGFDYKVITIIVELKMLEYLGIKPVIDECCSCGCKHDIVTLSSYRGGYLCKNCRREEAYADVRAIKLIRMFYYVDISKISKLDVSDVVIKQLNLFMDDYYDRYSGLYLKSKDFLKKLEKL